MSIPPPPITLGYELHWVYYIIVAICTINRQQNVCCNLYTCHTGLATQAFSHHIGFMCCHTGFSHHTGFIFCHTGFFLPHRFYLLPHRLSSPHRFYLSPHRLFSPHRFIFCHTGSFFTKANMLQDLLLSATQALFKIYLIALVQKPKPKVKIIFRSHSAHIHPLYGCFFLELILLFSLKHVLYFL